MENRVNKMLENLEILHELGRQRCFELGNPFYFQDAADNQEPGNELGRFYRKELPTGEIFLVSLKIIPGSNESFSFQDTMIRRIR